MYEYLIQIQFACNNAVKLSRRAFCFCVLSDGILHFTRHRLVTCKLYIYVCLVMIIVYFSITIMYTCKGIFKPKLKYITFYI